MILAFAFVLAVSGGSLLREAGARPNWWSFLGVASLVAAGDLVGNYFR